MREGRPAGLRPYKRTITVLTGDQSGRGRARPANKYCMLVRMKVCSLCPRSQDNRLIYSPC